MGKAVTVGMANAREVRRLGDCLVEAFNDYFRDHGTLATIDAMMGVQNFHAHVLRTLAEANGLNDRERALFLQMALDTFQEGMKHGD